MRGNSLKGVSVLAVALSAVTAAHAQQGSVASSAPQPELEAEIIVTGSRLVRPNVQSPIPVQSIDAADIDNKGATAIDQLLKELPSVGVSLGRVAQSGSNGNRSTGAALLNLRGLGAARTLVVVDGRRHVGTGFGSTAVDTQSIPSALIERVDVSTGGASVAYGADGVTGVVNIITRKKFDGVQLDGRYGVTDYSDGAESYAALTAGRQFFGDRASLIFNYTYNKQEEVESRARDVFAREAQYVANGPWIRAGAPLAAVQGDGLPRVVLADRQTTISIMNSGFVRAANLTGDAAGRANGPAFTFNPDGSVRLVDLGTLIGGTVSLNSSDPGQFRQNEFQELITPLTRNLALLKGSFDLSPSATLFAEFKYNKVEALSEGQAIIQGGGLTLNPANPFLGPALANPTFAALVNSGQARFSTAYATIGRRTSEYDRETWRGVIGLEGRIPSLDWAYELAFVQGKTNVDETITNDRIASRFNLALDAVANPSMNGVAGVATGAAVCRATLVFAQANGGSIANATDNVRLCAPMNVFGIGNISAAARAYALPTLFNSWDVEQESLTANLSGKVFDLPAGAITFATGYEYRAEDSRYKPCAPCIAGDTQGQNFQLPAGTTTAGGKYVVNDVYFEGFIPLLKNSLLARSLSIEGGARYSDYSTIGETTSYRANLDWQIVDDLRFRGGHAVAIRAPNIGELFSPAVANFAAGAATDPCSASNLGLGPNPAQRRANCTADLARLGLTSGTYVDPWPLNIGRGQISGGNPALKEELATSKTIGFVLTPRDIKNLFISVDRYEVKIEDAIGAETLQNVVNACYDNFTSINNPFCGSFRRDTTAGIVGAIRDIRTQALNFQSIETVGVDFEARMRFDLGQGSVRMGMTGGYLSKLEVKNPAASASPVNKIAGELANPRWKVNYSLGYDLGGLQVSWSGRYIGRSRFDVDNPTPEEDRDRFEVAPQFIQDMQARYSFEKAGLAKGGDVYFGINNLFNELPPVEVTTIDAAQTLGLALGTLNGGPLSLYDPVGRTFYAGLRLNF